jgi:hypothetical protein
MSAYRKIRSEADIECCSEEQTSRPSRFSRTLSNIRMSPAVPKSRFVKSITPDLTNGLARNDRSCRNYPNACHDR